MGPLNSCIYVEVDRDYPVKHLLSDMEGFIIQSCLPRLGWGSVIINPRFFSLCLILVNSCVQFFLTMEL